jgi:ribosomal protein S18 acetylase RimI-like enzyme
VGVQISTTSDCAANDLLIYLQQLDLPFELSVSGLQASLKNSQFIALAWAENRLVGVATAVSDLVLHTYLTFIAVVPEFRDRGIGYQLLARVQ